VVDPSGCTVLVVEDDPTIAEILRILLEDDGCRIVTAATGAAALDLAREERLDLVTLDLNLPDMDGLELLGQLGDVPVIVVSARSHVPRGHHRIVAVLPKPFDATRLEEAVRDALGCPGYQRARGREPRVN
jgi:DNA-binding response OmpR family regulator